MPRPPRTKHSLTKWANTGTIPYEPRTNKSASRSSLAYSPNTG